MTGKPIVVITVRGGLVEDVHANVPVTAFVEDWDCPPDRPLVMDFETEPLLPEQVQRILAREEHETTSRPEASMTLSNHDRAIRHLRAMTACSDDDIYTSFVDFLADAMHYCHLHGHSFDDALDTARMHFDAETTGDDLNLNHLTERNEP
jgi:hypothetical protein